MVRAATEWDTRFEVSDFELTQGGVSYTIDSARHFRALYPNDELFWVIGGDQLPQLHLWKDIGELAKIVEFIFLERPGYPVKAAPGRSRASAAPLRRAPSRHQLDRAAGADAPEPLPGLFRAAQGDCLHPGAGPVSGPALKPNKANPWSWSGCAAARSTRRRRATCASSTSRALSSITNYLVIATATSEPHVRALRVELEKALDAAKAQIVGMETARESGWAVMDAFDVMVHIFTPETRARYRLEKLWRDGKEIDVPRSGRS